MGAKLYRPCVGIALFNSSGHVFVGERIDTPGAWQMPQGGVDKGEPIERAVFRELHEETGVKNAELLELSSEPIRYDLPEHLSHLCGGKYAGQEQFWSAMRFMGSEADINLNTHTPPEFARWQWVPLSDTLEMIVPFKRSVYAQVIKMFAPHTRDLFS